MILVVKLKFRIMTREDIEKAADTGVENYVSENKLMGFRGSYKRGFVEGAEWRINSVWHDVSESPKPDKLIYILRKDGIIKQICTYDGVDKLFNTLMVYKWAYVEDLIPNTED